jgi:hypothetical protein
VTNETPAVISGGGTLKIDQTVRIHQEGPGRRAASVPEVLGRNEDCGPYRATRRQLRRSKTHTQFPASLRGSEALEESSIIAPFVLFPVSGEWIWVRNPPARFNPPPPSNTAKSKKACNSNPRGSPPSFPCDFSGLPLRLRFDVSNLPHRKAV